MRLIDADSLIENLSKWLKQVDPTHPSDIPPMDDIIVSTIMTIEEEPTVDPVRHGHWVEEIDPEENCWNEEVLYCSCCDEPIRVHETDNTYFLPTRKTLKYCPYCGAKMEGHDENR